MLSLLCAFKHFYEICTIQIVLLQAVIFWTHVGVLNYLSCHGCIELRWYLLSVVQCRVCVASLTVGMHDAELSVWYILLLSSAEEALCAEGRPSFTFVCPPWLPGLQALFTSQRVFKESWKETYWLVQSSWWWKWGLL